MEVQPEIEAGFGDLRRVIDEHGAGCGQARSVLCPTPRTDRGKRCGKDEGHRGWAIQQRRPAAAPTALLAEQTEDDWNGIALRSVLSPHETIEECCQLRIAIERKNVCDVLIRPDDHHAPPCAIDAAQGEDVIAAL
jgi:hypothetical protein